MPVTSLPIPPSRTDPVNFPARADTFLSALPNFALELNAVEASVNASEIAAVNAANTASAAANAAVTGSSVPAWVSGTTYTQGQSVWSPLTFQTFRRRTNGAGTTDPSSDSTNWEPLTVSSTSGITLNNNVSYKSRLSGGTVFDVLKIDSTNNTDLLGSAGVRFYTGGILRGFFDSNGRFGIGTATPTTDLDILRATTPVLRLARSTATAGESVISFDPVNSGFNVRDAQIKGKNDGSNRTSIAFLTANSDTPREVMSLSHLGNLYINAAPELTDTKLVVQQSATSSVAEPVMKLQNSQSNGPTLLFGVNATNGAWNPLVSAGNHYLVFGKTSATDSSSVLRIVPWSNAATGVTLDSFGRVGIGATGVPLGLAHLTSVQPELIMTESDQSAGNRSWKFMLSGSTFSLGTIADDNNSMDIAYRSFRSGNSVTAQEFLVGGNVKLQITAGAVNYEGIEIGYKNVPRVTTTIEQGKCLATASGVTLSTGQADGSTFAIYNDSGAAITLTQGAGLTLRLAGTTSTGNRTIGPRGWATVWYNSTTEAIVSGAGVS